MLFIKYIRRTWLYMLIGIIEIRIMLLDLWVRLIINTLPKEARLEIENKYKL